MRYGYARVSSSTQETTLQRDALRRAGVRTVFVEQRSAVKYRPELEALVAKLKPGDEVVVYKLDRLARSVRDFIRIWERIASAGASFRSLTEPVDTTTPAGQLMLHMLAAFAQFEWSMIRERSMAGQEAARARGVQFGRPAKVDYPLVRRLRAGGLSIRQIAARVGSPYSSVASALRPRYVRRA